MPRLLFLLLALLPSLVQAASPIRPVKLGQCAACHGETGRSRVPGTPHLAGQDEAYLVAALQAYRSGTRRAMPMNALANTLQPQDVAAMARWYARQSGPGKP